MKHAPQRKIGNLPVTSRWSLWHLAVRLNTGWWTTRSCGWWPPTSTLGIHGVMGKLMAQRSMVTGLAFIAGQRLEHVSLQRTAQLVLPRTKKLSRTSDSPGPERDRYSESDP